MDETTDRIRVLHVDDDRAFGELTARLLEREDDRFDVTSVASADAGLDVFESEPVDCVVSDYDMAGTDGLAFLEAIRERDGEVPFVLFTGQGNERVAGEAVSAGATDYLQKGVGSDQYAVLANRITNAVSAYRARRRAARQERINTLIREVNRRLVDAVTVEGIERAVCETLADSAPYRFAWIGEPDPESGEIVPRVSAGDGEGYLEEVTIYHDDRPRGWGPAGMAVRTREVQLVRNVPEDPSFEPWRDAAAAYGYRSVVVLPLIRGDLLHGVLAIYADHPDAFTGVERNVLAELAETVGRALEAAHVRSRLRTRERADADVTERHYRAIAEGLPNGAVALFDTDLRYTVVGGAVFEDLDLSAARLEGSSLREAHSERFRDAHLHHYRAALAGEHRSFEFEYDGRTFRAHVVPVRDASGSVVAGLALTQDVTAERARERVLERQNERLEALAGAVSCDLRDPLDAASEHLDAALEASESEHLDAVARAHERMRTRIEGLLALARAERTALDVEPVALGDALLAAWRGVDAAGPAPAVETDRVVRADRTRLQQLFENLARTAVGQHSTSPRPRPPEDATPRGRAEGWTRTDGTGPTGSRRTALDGSSAPVSAGDSPTPDGHAGAGPLLRLGGLEEGFYVQVAGPVGRAERPAPALEPGRETETEWTDFGLYVVRRIAEAHDWTLSVAGEPDDGTRFEFTGVEFGR
ncbi:MAG: GAF domain-containing protein [Haloarculaceae archaeon]